jgi:hypothetical protein
MLAAMILRRSTLGRGLLLAGFTLLAVVRVSAVFFFGTDDPTHNTTPPEAPLAASGWQWEGDWMSFLGTAIGPHHFLTARHVAGPVGGQFLYRGQSYRTTAAFDDPTGDLKIWRVCGTLPDFAPLYEKTNEVDRAFVVIGRGTRRGIPVYFTNEVSRELRGWGWGKPDNVRRWGTNVVSRIVPDTGNGGGDLLTATFDRDGGADESSISGGDSGGAIFIRDGETWKVAGICSYVDAGFSYTNAPPTFSAALFDAGGFYVDNNGTWELLPDTEENLMTEMYLTRVSTRLAWIQGILNQPPPPGETPELLASTSAGGPFVAAIGAALSSESDTFTVPATGNTQYYRIKSACPSTITSLQVVGDSVVIKFQGSGGAALVASSHSQ